MKKHFIILGVVGIVGIIMIGLSLKSNNKIASEISPNNDISNPVSDDINNLKINLWDKNKYEEIHLKILSYESTGKISAESRVYIDEMLEDAYSHSLCNEFENWFSPPFSSTAKIQDLMDEIQIQKGKSTINALSESIDIYAKYKQATRLKTKTKKLVARKYNEVAVNNLKKQIKGLTTNIEYELRTEIREINQGTLQTLEDFYRFHSTFVMYTERKPEQIYKLAPYCDKLDTYLYYKTDSNFVNLCYN